MKTYYLDFERSNDEYDGLTERTAKRSPQGIKRVRGLGDTVRMVSNSRSPLLAKLRNFILAFRIKLIRCLIGKLSIVANATTDGNIMIGNGLAYNVHFAGGKIDPRTYNDRLQVLPNSFAIVDYCAFEKRE
jgi:hypothetical protein